MAVRGGRCASHTRKPDRRVEMKWSEYDNKLEFISCSEIEFEISIWGGRGTWGRRRGHWGQKVLV